MGVRERVHRAIESSVADADKTLSEVPHAGDHERLTILLDGWFRGLGNALEELAVEVDLLRDDRTRGDAPEPGAPEVHVPEQGRPWQSPADGRDDAPLDEAALADRARASREETEAVRAEARDPTTDETTEKEE